VTILLKQDIRDMCIPNHLLAENEKKTFAPMITPFEQRRTHRTKEDTENKKILLASENIKHGYDIHVDFGDETIVPPKSFMIVKTIENFNMPHHITGIVFGKKYLMRMRLMCEVSFLASRWSGHVKIKIINMSRKPVRVKHIRKIARVVFFKNN